MSRMFRMLREMFGWRARREDDFKALLMSDLGIKR